MSSCKVRHNVLVSQRVEVALVYKEMLGIDAAMVYLEQEKIPREVAERILLSKQYRQSTQLPPAAEVSQAQYVQCRRRNRIHDAIVEAALKIETKLGADWAVALLKDEKVPDEVMNRVLGEGPRQVRAKKSGPTN